MIQKRGHRKAPSSRCPKARQWQAARAQVHQRRAKLTPVVVPAAPLPGSCKQKAMVKAVVLSAPLHKPSGPQRKSLGRQHRERTGRLLELHHRRLQRLRSRSRKRVQRSRSLQQLPGPVVPAAPLVGVARKPPKRVQILISKQSSRRKLRSFPQSHLQDQMLAMMVVPAAPLSKLTKKCLAE